MICAYTMTPILHQKNLAIIDFEIMNEEDDNLLVLTGEPSYRLQLLAMPGKQIN